MSTKEIRILMFSNIYGGKNTFIHNEIINLRKDFEIKYIALEEIRNEKLNKFFNNYKIIPLHQNRFINKIKWWLWKQDLYLSFKNKSFSKKLTQEVSNFRPNVIHLHFGYEALKFLDNFYSDSVSFIIHFHGYDASAMFRKKSYLKKLKYYLSLKNVHTVFVSEFIKTRFQQNQLDTTRSNVIKCGIDLSKFNQKESAQINTNKNWNFTQVSSQVEKKGISYAIKGFGLFLENNKGIDAIFNITGTPTVENLALVKKLNLEKKIIFKGLLDHQKVKELLESTDVFVHCSVTSKDGDEEGIPTAIMEAMAMGIPILSTFHSGIPELVINNKHGVLVEEKNPIQISQALEKIIGMVPIRDDMQSYLKENNYDLESHLLAISNLYKRLSI